MFFLLRAAFWLSLVILLLPAAPGGEGQGPSTAETFSAAQTAFADMRGLCDRQPAVCETAGATFAQFGHKARYGALWLYETVDGLVTGTPAAPTQTGSVPIEHNAPHAGTLNASDRAIVAPVR